MELVSLRAVENGFIVTYYDYDEALQETIELEYVVLTIDEALGTINSLMTLAKEQVDLTHLSDTSINAQRR
jgi:hypothetical protein